METREAPCVSRTVEDSLHPRSGSFHRPRGAASQKGTKTVRLALALAESLIKSSTDGQHYPCTYAVSVELFRFIFSFSVFTM